MNKPSAPESPAKEQPSPPPGGTPRTDNELVFLGDGHRSNMYVHAYFARQLERELSSAQTEIAGLNGIIRVRTTALASLADELRLEREDARRYRWLREQMGKNLPETWKVVEELGAIACYTSNKDFDAAIDASMKEPR